MPKECAQGSLSGLSGILWELERNKGSSESFEAPVVCFVRAASCQLSDLALLAASVRALPMLVSSKVLHRLL